MKAGNKALVLTAAVIFCPNALADQTDEAKCLVTVSYSADQIVWTPTETPPAGYGLQLTVNGPYDWYLRRQFGPGAAASFSQSDQFAVAPPDGSYTYELKLVVIDPLLMTTRFDEDSEFAYQPPAPSYSGSFRLSDGVLAADPDVPEGIATRQTITENLIVQANLCVGNDCTEEESFGNDIIRLKEINTRIHFDDTSTQPDFPANDWRLIANDSTTGGADKFSIEDSTAGNTPFTIEAGARNNAFYVQSDGDVGIGTSVPVFNLHVVDGNTPTLRLEQDASSTFTPQTWDIAGNESNFYVKDATAAGNLVFRIQAGAPENSMFIESTGDVGLGTNSPSAALHIRRTSVEKDMLLIQPAGAGDPLFRIKGSGDASLLKVLSD